MADIIDFSKHATRIAVFKPPQKQKQCSGKISKQGDLDSLCGLYAIINAVSYVAHLKLKDQKALFAHLVNELEGRGSVASSLLHGTKRKQQLRMLKSAKKYMSKHYDVHLVIHPIFEASQRLTTTTYCKALQCFLQSKRCIVIVGLFGMLNHLTCITSVSDASLRLLDSTGITFIRRKSCRITRNISRQHHCLHPLLTWGISLKD